MRVTRTVEPTTEPVTLDEAKAHLRVEDHNDDDAYITSLIPIARRSFEIATGRTLIDTTFTQSVRYWETAIELLRGDAHTINSVTYDSAPNGDSAVVSDSLYKLHLHGDGNADIVFYDTFDKPELFDQPRVNRIHIEFVAGHGAQASAVPGPVKQAVLYLIQHFFDNRSMVNIGASVTKVPKTFDYLLNQFRIPRSF